MTAHASRIAKKLWSSCATLRDAENLPEPEVLAGEIAEELRSALEQIEEILGDLASDA